MTTQHYILTWCAQLPEPLAADESDTRRRNTGSHPLVPDRRPLRVHQRDRGDHLGHLVAPYDRPRHLLDAGTPRDLRGRAGGGAVRRMAGTEDDVCRLRNRSRALCADVGLSRAARSLGGDLGRDRDAHLSAARRLVAQRLRTRCRDPESTPCGPRPGHLLDPARGPAHGAVVAESRVGARAAPAGLCLRLQRGLARGDARGAHDGILDAERLARSRVPHDLGGRLPAGAVRGGPSRTTPLAGDLGGGRLHGNDAGDDVGASAVSRRATACAHPARRGSDGAAGIPAAAGRSRDRARHAPAAGRRDPARRRPGVRWTGGWPRWAR